MRKNVEFVALRIDELLSELHFCIQAFGAGKCMLSEFRLDMTPKDRKQYGEGMRFGL